LIVLLPEEVYIIGSILEEGNFYAFSDIDIAVRGLKDGYSKVYGDLEEMVGRNIDLIDFFQSKSIIQHYFYFS